MEAAYVNATERIATSNSVRLFPALDAMGEENLRRRALLCGLRYGSVQRIRNGGKSLTVRMAFPADSVSPDLPHSHALRSRG